MIRAESKSDGRFFEQVRAAPFIFSGRVLKTGASTIPQLSADARLAIVRVTKVFRWPVVLGAPTGKHVTVQLTEGKPMRIGQVALFYAAPWLYGKDIAVVELAREAAPKDVARLLERVARAELSNADDMLQARLSAAELVLSGLVDRIAPIEPFERGFRSEHDPMWWRAEIAIDHVEKGKLREPRYAAYFPSSLDQYWLEVPKLQVGQRGMYLLHRAAKGKQGRFPPPGLALMDPLDFQPPSQLERVRALLKLSQR